MKQLTLVLGLLISATAFGQKEVVSAYNANKDGDYRAAATYIEQAILVEKAAIKEKTWRYRGEIYLNIAADSSASIEYPNALVIAKESYQKSMEIDTKGRYEDENRAGLSRIQYVF